MYGFVRRAFAKSMGLDDADLARPIIGIAQTQSDLNNCNNNFRELAEYVKRGVWQAGGTPLEFPTISLGELFMRPTTMLYRNLMAMDTEEMIRAHPLDGVVLLGNCDKTTPAQMMGAASANIPSIMLTGGPHLSGRFRGESLGACSDCRRFWAEYRAGTIDADAMARARGRHQPLGRPLHGHGHRLDDGRDGRGARAWRCPAPRRSRPRTRAGCGWPRPPADRSSRPSRLAFARAMCSRRAPLKTRSGLMMALGGSTNPGRGGWRRPARRARPGPPRHRRAPASPAAAANSARSGRAASTSAASASCASVHAWVRGSAASSSQR